jgi:hypothetical protein
VLNVSGKREFLCLPYQLLRAAVILLNFRNSRRNYVIVGTPQEAAV